MGKDQGEDSEDGANDVKEKSPEEEAGLVLEHHDKTEYRANDRAHSKDDGEDEVNNPH